MTLLTELRTAIQEGGVKAGVSWGGRLFVIALWELTVTVLDKCFPFRLHGERLRSTLRENGTLIEFGRPYDISVEIPPGTTTRFPDFINTGRRRVPKPFVGSLRNVRLVGAVPIPVWRGRVLQECLVNMKILVLHVGYSLADLLKQGNRGSESIDQAALIYNHWSSGYFHWVIESLPRIECLRKYEEETGESVDLIVPGELTTFQRETLELFGYSEDDLIHYDSTTATVDELVVPSNRRSFYPSDPAPVDYRWLRERMLEATDATEATDTPSRIYISREDAPTRQVVNQPEVERLLADYGFETVVLSENSVVENVRLFANADVVVAPHGAGLTDIIYGTDLSVIELVKDEDCSSAYFLLSQSVGHDYRPVMCESKGKDLEVPLDELSRAMRETTELAAVA